MINSKNFLTKFQASVAFACHALMITRAQRARYGNNFMDFDEECVDRCVCNYRYDQDADVIIIVAHQNAFSFNAALFLIQYTNHCIRLCIVCNNTVDQSALNSLIIVRLLRCETRDKILGNTGFHSFHHCLAM